MTCNSLCSVRVNVTEERLLVASGWKSMDWIHDRAVPNEWLPDVLNITQSRRAVERRRNRGRDGGPGPCKGVRPWD